MNFELDDQQRLLKESVDKLARATGGLAAVHAAASGDAWNNFAELGLLGLPFSDADGGFGGGPVETMIVAEALGRELNLEPYVASLVLAGSLVRFSASPSLRGRLVPGIVDGSTRLAFAHQERQARHDLTDVETVARIEGETWAIEGAKAAVPAGDCATLLIVSARTAGGRFDRDGLALFLVDPTSPGVGRRGYTAHDGTRGADFTFDAVRVADAARLDGGDAADLIGRAADAALAASFAESVGLMDAMLALTVEHLKTRSQFGRKLGEFQALQHRTAEMLVALEQARSMAMFATSMAESEDATARRRAVSAARVQVSDSLRFVGQQAVQLHGGIGITEEHAIGRCFKRATALECFLGDGDHHLGLFAESEGFLPPHEQPLDAAAGADTGSASERRCA